MIREVYNKLSVNYRLTSLTISLIIFIILLFFTTKVKWYPLDFISLVVATTMSILVGYQYMFINKISSNICPTFEELSPLFQNNHYVTFSQDLERKLQKSWLFYSTVILVITPFVILELIKVWKWRWSNELLNLFYLYEPTPWSLLLDIFNHVIGYLILFLLAKIIWIIIELTLIINELQDKDNQKKDIVKINVFEVEEIGGLRPLSSFVQFIVSNYFIIITLFIISYVPPNETTYKILITPEIIILIVMLLIGIILFMTTQKTIGNLIDKGIKLELDRINRNYEETYYKVIEICSNKRTNNNKNELEELRITLDILETEKIRIKKIKDKKFDIKTVFTFVTTTLPPIIALIQKILALSLLDKLMLYFVNIKISL